MIKWTSWDNKKLKKRPSILAVIETLVASGISLGLAIYYEVWLHIAVSTIIAPILLLRTPTSTRLGLKVFVDEGYKARRWYKEKQAFIAIFSSMFWISTPFLIWVLYQYWSPATFIAFVMTWFTLGYLLRVFAILALVVKIKCTCTTIYHRFSYSIGSIPKNWAQICFMTDMSCPPEIVPEIEKYEAGKYFRSSNFFRSFLLPHKKNKIISALDYFAMIFSTATMYATSYLYRLSLKSSSIIYLPLLWVVRQDRVDDKNISIRLEEICSVFWEKVKRGYALLVIVSSLGVVAYILSIGKIKGMVLDNWIIQFWIPVESVGSWHITRLGAALVTWWLLWYAQTSKLDLTNSSNSNTEKILSRLLIAEGTRFVLSLFTLACGGYLLVSNVDWSIVPKIEWLPEGML